MTAQMLMLIWMATALGLAAVAMLGILKKMVESSIESVQTIKVSAKQYGLESESRHKGILRCFEISGLSSSETDRGN